jgi:hypothetical protein
MLFLMSKAFYMFRLLPNLSIFSNRRPYLSYLLTYLLIYLPTYLLTPRSRFLLEKPTDLQLVKKFPAFYGTRRFITAFTIARHLSLSLASSIQSILPHPTSRRSALMLPSRLRLGLPSHLKEHWHFYSAMVPSLPERCTVEKIVTPYPSAHSLFLHICLLTVCIHGSICVRSELLPNFQGTRESMAFAVTSKCKFNQ